MTILATNSEDCYQKTLRNRKKHNGNCTKSNLRKSVKIHLFYNEKITKIHNYNQLSFSFKRRSLKTKLN